jgi:DNA repair exonuclease SbcCD ATPase subunit
MHIDFRSLKLKNFRSVKEAELTFIPGLHLIVGDNRVDEFAISNGAGKSTLLPYAIPYALYGRFKSPNGKVVRSGFKRRQAVDEICSVDLQLDIDKKAVQVNRGRRGAKPFLKVEGAETPIKGDQELSSLIGCDFSTLTSLLVLTRASVEGGLFYGTDSKRKEFFLALAGIDELIEHSIEVLKSFKSEFSLNSIELRTMYDVEKKNVNIESEVARINKLLREIESKLSVATSTVDQFAMQSELLTQSKLMHENAIAEINKKILGYEDAQTKLLAYTEVFERRSAAQTSVNHLQGRVNELETQRRAAVNLKGVCNNCFQEIPPEHIKKVLQSIEGTKATFQNQITEQSTKLQTIKQEIQSVEELKEKISGLLKTSRDKRIELMKEESGIAVSLSNLSYSYQEALKVIDEYNPWRASLEQQLQELQLLQVRIGARIASLNEDAACFYSLDQACNSWVTFLKSTLPAYALSEMTSYMSLFVDRCIKVLWDSNVSISIQFDKATEDLVIQIKDTNQEDMSIDSLSAGEQARVFLSLALGAIIATRSFRGWSSNLFILDEVFDMLDQMGREVVYSLLHDLAQQFGLCCYVISHHTQPTSVVTDSILRLIKDGDGSILERRT